jgi:hypothetical protein
MKSIPFVLLTSLLFFSACASKPLPYKGRYAHGLDMRQINGTVREHKNDVKACYDQVLPTNPALKGKVVVSFLIQKDGKVTDAEVLSDTMKSEEFNACLLNVIGEWVFPEAPAKTNVPSYPFYFHKTEAQ